MLWLSLSSSLSLPKYEKQCNMAATGHSRAVHIFQIYLGKDNEEERDNHSIVSMNDEYNSL